MRLKSNPFFSISRFYPALIAGLVGGFASAIYAAELDASPAKLHEAPSVHRDGLQFLLENMPERDLQNLPASLLAENVDLAYQAFETAPWRDRIPQEIFLNDILPYACVNEKRDDWRKLLRDKCAPLVADCNTPDEAAQRLNKKLFKLVNVRYSTERRRADQSPLQSMESGLATRTGLSILLIDACRSVGVPARLAGPVDSDTRRHGA